MTASTFSHVDLHRFTGDVFKRMGLPDGDAELVAQGLVDADLRGLHSHGVARVPIYVRRLKEGVVNPTPNIEISNPSRVAALVDGDDGMGFVVGDRAMDVAIDLAADSGIGMVGVHRSTHYGMAAIYVMQAMARGYIGIAFTNSSPALPVWGGRSVFLGAAPLAAGVPGGKLQPYVLDMAMTVIARGKIRLAAQRGESIPEGLALDADGRPTTDAKKAFDGVCLPMAGAKGAALSMLMDILGGIFTGANYGGDVKSLYYDFSGPQNVGHLFLAIDPGLFIGRDAFEARMDEMVTRVKGQARAESFDEILIPGEPETRKRQDYLENGVPLTPDIVDALTQVASDIDVEMFSQRDR